MCDYGCVDNENQGIHIDPNDKHFWHEVDSFRCWGQTHDTDVRLWRRATNKSNKSNTIIKVTTLGKVQRAILGVKMAFAWVAEPKWPRNSSTGIRGHVHNTTRPECKHWVGHPTHAECSHYNTCPDHTHRTALMLELISAPQIYNCDFIHKLAIIQWNQGCLAVPEVTLDGTQQHMLYIRGI